MMDVAPFFLQELMTFLVIASENETFLAVVSSPLPSSHVVYPVFFLNSATKKLFCGGTCQPKWSAPLVTPLEL